MVRPAGGRLPSAAAERLTRGWYRHPGCLPGDRELRGPAVVGASSRGERFAAAAVTLPVGAGVAILVELTALGRRVAT